MPTLMVPATVATVSVVVEYVADVISVDA